MSHDVSHDVSDDVSDDESDGLCFEDGRRRNPRISAKSHNDWPACGVSELLFAVVCSAFRQM